MDEDFGDIPVPINNDLDRRIAEIFGIFDHAANKTIDLREVGTVVRALGCCPSEAELQELLVAVEDSHIPGCVHLVHFLPYMAQSITEHKYQPATPDKLLEAFHVLDPERHGYVSKDYITTLMTQDGEPFSQDELDEMMEIAIDPHTNTIPYEYYINKLMHEPKAEDDLYKIADAIEAAKPPPPPPPKRFSEMMAAMASMQNIG